MSQSVLGTRRQFLKTATTSAAVLGLGFERQQRVSGNERESINNLDVKIDRVLNCRVSYDRPRIVAGNSKYRLAGGSRTDSVLILFGNNGKIGVGCCRSGAKPTDGRFLIGKPLSNLLNKQVSEVNQRTGTSAIWDLAGKSLNKPVYALLGGEAPKGGVPVYDGTIYHEELLSRDRNSAYRNRNSKYDDQPDWSDIIKEAIDVSEAHGHKFVKVKIGRGAKHLSRKAGNYQDAAVLQLIREYAGNDFGIGVDANNGYTLEDTLWLLRECGDLNLAFIEEMFPEDIEKYRQVREVLAELKLDTLVADGENWRAPSDAATQEMIQSGVIDILQGDMRRFEIEGIMDESRLAEAARHGSRIAPHNWGSEFGFYMQIHVACAISNFYRAEHDLGEAKDDTLIKHGYKIKDGFCMDFDAPGFGVQLNTRMLDNLKSRFDVKA